MSDSTAGEVDGALVVGDGKPVHRGRWFEEFSVGMELVSSARTVTEADVALFAGLSGDFNPVHCDEPFARRTAFRGRVAHGALVLSFATGMAWQTGAFDGTIAAVRMLEAWFDRPVFAGDTLHLRMRVHELDPDPRPRRGEIVLDTSVLNQSGEVVAHGRWGLIVLRRRQGSA